MKRWALTIGNLEGGHEGDGGEEELEGHCLSPSGGEKAVELDVLTSPRRTLLLLYGSKHSLCLIFCGVAKPFAPSAPETRSA